MKNTTLAFMSPSLRALTLVGGLAIGCGAGPRALENPSPVVASSPAALKGSAPVPVTDGPLDPKVAALVDKYRAGLGERFGEILGTASADITTDGEPSSPLGELFADLLFEEMGERGYPVDAFITNDGGIRAPLFAGPIRLGAVFEIMPFENELVVVQLTGAKLQAICDHLAKVNGEPVSHLRMVFTGHLARDVQVSGAPLEPAKVYRIGTSDYLAESGWMKSFAQGAPLERTGLTMREGLAAALKRKHQAGLILSPSVDDRLTRKEAP